MGATTTVPPQLIPINPPAVTNILGAKESSLFLQSSRSVFLQASWLIPLTIGANARSSSYFTIALSGFGTVCEVNSTPFASDLWMSVSSFANPSALIEIG